MKRNVIKEKGYSFALKIVKLYDKLNQKDSLCSLNNC